MNSLISNPDSTSSIQSDYGHSTRSHSLSSSKIHPNTEHPPASKPHIPASIHPENSRRRINQGLRWYNESLNRKFIRLPKLDRKSRKL